MARQPNKLYIALVALFIIAPSGYSEESEKDAKLYRLLAQSNFTEQIYQFPNVMKSSISQIYDMGLCDQEALNTINQAIELTVKPKYLNDILHKDLTGKISEKQIDSLLKWYNSPLGKKVSKLELNASNPNTYTQMKNKSDKLFENKERVALAKELDKIANATNWAVNIEMQSKIAMYSALAQIQHKNISETLMQIASQLDKQKSETQPQVEKSILLWYLYAFEKLSDDEIKGYIKFMKKKDTRTFNQTSLNSLAYAITKVTERFLVVIQGISRSSNEQNQQQQ